MGHLLSDHRPKSVGQNPVGPFGRPIKRRREVIVPLVALCAMSALWTIAFS